MKLSNLFVVVFALVLAFPSFAEAPATPEPATPVAPAADAGSCDLVPAEAPLFQASCGLCPVWAPPCTKDSQCDAFCGGTGWGACLPWQACTRCCGCNT